MKPAPASDVPSPGIDGESPRHESLLDVDRVVRTIAAVVGAGGRPIPLHEPEFTGNESVYLNECLETSQVSSTGPFVIRFEQALAQFTGARYAIATVNGTAALHVALNLVGVRPGDEVLTPSLTFVAAANATRYCGAIPHFIDSEALTLGVDPGKLADHLAVKAAVRDGHCVNRETGRRIAAALPMHTFGHPVDLDPLTDLCDRYGIPLVEEAANALGSLYKGRHAGTTGRMGIISFNGNKIVTTGGGGAILTSDPALAETAKHLTTTGKLPHRWAFDHDRVAYNYRLPNINAALGCAQLERLATCVERKRRLAQRYAAAFDGVDGARIFVEPPFARSNYWLNTLLLDADTPEPRDLVLARTHDAGILTRPAWTPMHLLPMFADCPRMDLTVAERLATQIVSLPSSARLGD